MRKKIFFCTCMCTLLLCLHLDVFAYELKGLQPVQPGGMFSSFKTVTLDGRVIAIGADIERSIDTDYYRATLKTGYGITDTIEILTTLPYVFEWENSQEGFEDMYIGMKHRVFSGNKYGPSLAYIVKFSLPTGTDEFTTNGAIGGGIVIGKKLGPFSTSLNFFYSHPFDNSFDDQYEIIAGVDLRASHDFDILAEIYAVDSYTSDSFQTVEGRFGYRIKTAENIYTLIGAGYDFKNRDPEFRLMVSFNFVFENLREIYRENE